MAEVLGLVASVITIVETGAKVATTLGKLSVKLKTAGKEAKEIAKKVKLVSKVLKQLESKLTDGQSLVDLSLVEEYILVCQERMTEADRLIKVLEREMNSSSTWDRARFRVRFILEKSTFALLQQDMDSLQLTLDLYVTTLTFQKVEENGIALQDIREKLEDLKQEVEDDLQIRSASAAVNAAILTIQYNDLVASHDSTASHTPELQMVRKELCSDTGDDSFGGDEHSFVQDLSVSVSREEIVVIDGNPSVALSALDDDAISNVLAVFAQIRMVQKKTLRRLSLQLEQRSTPPAIAPTAPSVFDDKTADSQSSIEQDVVEERIHTQSKVQHRNPSDRRYKPPTDQSRKKTSRYTDEILFDTRHQLSREQRESARLLDPIQTATRPLGDLVATIPEQSSQEIRDRERLANHYSGKCFAIVNCKTSKVIQVDFSNLRKASLPQIMLDVHTASLDNDPPQPKFKSARMANTYCPPAFGPLAARSKSSTELGSTALHTSSSNKWAPERTNLNLEGTEDQCPTELLHREITAFATYVVAYAQWYTDRCRLAALRDHQIDYRLTKRRHDVTAIDPVSCGEVYHHLAPGVEVSIIFASRQLADKNMIGFRDETQDRSWVFVGEGPYSEHLRALGEFDGFDCHGL